ncbi:MAG: hypothetical protein AB8F95_16670 [Bacteroidia bacterium]
MTTLLGFVRQLQYKNQEVAFLPDGSMNGLDSFIEYSVPEDYSEPGMDVDIVWLSKGEKNQRFGFKFAGDTLRIHKLNCVEPEDDYCAVVELGEVVYRLIRL